MITISMLLLLFSVSLSYAVNADRDQLFKQGVSAYVGEDYQNAIALFSQLEKSKKVSWELYYNLGNSYYRNGELGNAIRYWEKAKILAPSNSDIDHNLLIAEKHIIDKVVLPDMFPLFKWYKQMQRHLSLSFSIQLIGALLLLFQPLAFPSCCSLSYLKIALLLQGSSLLITKQRQYCLHRRLALILPYLNPLNSFYYFSSK